MVKLEKLTNAQVKLDTFDGFELQADYQGNSNQALLYHSKSSRDDKVDSKEQVVRLSNVPNGLQLHVRIPDFTQGDECSGGKDPKERDVRVTAGLGNSVSSILYAYRSAKEDCAGQVSDMSLRADAKGIPAGSLVIRSYTLGNAGILQVQSSGGAIQWVNVEYTKEGSINTKVSATNVWLYTEWDLDGDYRYKGSPKFMYLNTNGNQSGIKSFQLQAKGGVYILRGHLSATNFQIKREYDPWGIAGGAAVGALVGGWRGGPWGAALGAAAGGYVDSMFKVSGTLCASAVGSAGFEWSNGAVGLGIPIVGCKVGEW